MYFSEILNATAPYAFIEELDWIRNFAMEVNTNPQAEIYNYVMLGAGPGVFAVALSEGNHLIPITVVDINNCHWVKEHLRLSHSLNPFLGIIGDSAVYGKTYQGPPVDLLIVDAAHDQESVEKDIDAWFPHVRVGGHIFFHDYMEREGGFNGMGEWDLGGVARAIINRIDDNWEHVIDVGISIVFRKVK